jgi:hypothetical protein
MADPKHPDSAALVERANARLLVMSRVESPTYGQAANGEIIEELRDALLTLARPVEDEEIRRIAGYLKRWPAMTTTQKQQADNAASLLARLAREKTSAQQEIARLREAMAPACKELRRIAHYAGDQRPLLMVIMSLESALAAAAGTPE